MSEKETQERLHEVEYFLKNKLNKDISTVKNISGGERSKAYLFETDESKFILRINSHEAGFLKDKYAYNNFGKYLPIPRIIDIGKYQNKFYAISEYCEGLILDKNTKLTPSLRESVFINLDKIHSISVPDQGKYGVADINGIAGFDSWEKWVFKKNTPVTKEDESYYLWNEIKRIDFVDEKIIDEIFAETKELISYIPKETHVIHADFGPGNIVIRNNQVVGIIDWNEFGYGDFLFDLAYLDFWIPSNHLITGYKEHAQKNQQYLSNFNERIRCHQLFIALNTMGIYAAIGWKDGYSKTLERINNIRNLSTNRF